MVAMRPGLICKALLPIVAATSVAAHAQEPQRCSEFKSEVTLGALSGHRIDSVDVQTAQPDLGRFSALTRIRRRTQPEVIRRELLFAPGDSVDTLRVAESLRRLRQLAFLEYVRVDAHECQTPAGPVLSLQVVTRDGWTARPEIKSSKGSPRIGLTERDLFGSGRTVSFDVVSHDRSLGVGVSTYDAFGFGTGLTTRARFQRYYDGTIRTLSFGRRETSVNDRWRAGLELWDQRYEPKIATGDNFERAGGDFLAGMRVSGVNDSHVVHVLGGIESELTSLIASPSAQLVGPARIVRRFTGPEVGLSVRSAKYDTLTWLLAGGAVVDVPRSLETEVVLGVGPGAITSSDLTGPIETGRTNFMTHYTAWLGREWLPTRKSRIISDVWASGFNGLNGWRSGRVRGALSAERAAPNGVWTMSMAGEHLTDPDPDIRALTLFDRSLAFVPRDVRFAESAITVSLDRMRHLVRLSAAYELDGSVFGAYSKRWGLAAPTVSSNDFGIGIVGLGLSLASRRPGRSSIRLDYGVPISAPAGVRRVPRFSISLTPWLGTGRRRDKPSSF
jgi:hypothetical protein